MNFQKFIKQCAARNRKIYKLRTKDGLTFEQIGKRYKLSHQRVQAICRSEADKHSAELVGVMNGRFKNNQAG